MAADNDGGVINWAYTSDQPNWDPVVVGATSATQLLSTIYEPLFTLTPAGTIAPALAESYKYNSAGTAVTITLKSGLKFQDGSPVNAQAVAFNVHRIQTQTNSALKSLWQDVASATAIDATHVLLKLKSVDYQIPYILANRSSLLASEQAAKDPNKLNTQRSPVTGLDAGRAESDRASRPGDQRNRQRRGGAEDTGVEVVLREPVPLVAEFWSWVSLTGRQEERLHGVRRHQPLTCSTESRSTRGPGRKSVPLV